MLRHDANLFKHALVDEQRPQHKVGGLQRAALPDTAIRATLIAEGFEQHAVHRSLHEAGFEDHELTSFSTARDEVLDQLMKQGDARSLVDELVQPEHGVLI